MENDRGTQIIKTAVKRFARHGLGKTTLSEIARDLRIGKATIYHYFTSKEDLFYRTLEYDASLFIEDIKQIFDNPELPLKDKFIQYFNYKQDIFIKYKLLYDLMIRILKEEGFEKEIEILKRLIQNEEEVLTQVLDLHEGKKPGDINPELPKYFASQSWGILFGSRLNSVIGDSVQNSKELLYGSLECILNSK